MRTTDFKLCGYWWALNDNRKCISKANYVFFPKYKLLRWLEVEHAWLDTGIAFDTKKAACKYIREQKRRGLI